ncbi:MAG: NAD-dependent epimerase/dehydratase family protein [Nanoarchaeota archaeon]
MNTDIIQEDLERAQKVVNDAAKGLEGGHLLITGGAGFIGSYVVDFVHHLNTALLSEPAKITVIDNFITGIPENLKHLKDKITLISHDIIKPIEIKEDITHMIHAASIASPLFYRKHPLETMDVNVIGTRNMLELARKKGPKSFMFLSTSEIYGDPDPKHIPTKEDYRGFVSCCGPRACYDESKRYGETMCAVFHERYGLPIKTTRMFNVYGPRLSLEDKRVIPDFIKNVREDKDIIMFSDGSPTRSFCYISDSVAGHFLVLLKGAEGEAYNIGNDKEEISMRQLAQTVIDVSGKPLKVVFDKSEDEHYLTDNPLRRCPDITKLKQLGYDPKVMLKEGLARTMKWHSS